MRAHIPHLHTSPHPHVIPRLREESRTCALTSLISIASPHPHVIPRLREESRTCALTSLISTPLPTPMSFRGSARNLGLARSHPSSPPPSLDEPQMLQVRLWRAPRRESRDENSGLDNITGMLNLARFLELCNGVSKAEGRGVRACLPTP